MNDVSNLLFRCALSPQTIHDVPFIIDARTKARPPLVRKRRIAVRSEHAWQYSAVSNHQMRFHHKADDGPQARVMRREESASLPLGSTETMSVCYQRLLAWKPTRHIPVCALYIPYPLSDRLNLAESRICRSLRATNSALITMATE